MSDLHRAIGIYPYGTRLAFAVIESPLVWIASGTCEVGRNGRRIAGHLEKHFQKYSIDRLGVEDGTTRGRGQAAVRCVSAAVGIARLYDVEPFIVTKGDVRKALGASSLATEHDVASLVAVAVPELGPYRKRKPWQSEADRMKICRAGGLALAALRG